MINNVNFVPTRGQQSRTTILLSQSFSLAAGGVEAPAEVMNILQQRDPHPLRPGAFVYGAATGPMVPPNWRGGVFILSPTGNPLNFGEENGNSIFVSKNVVSGRINPLTAFSRGGVGTFNPATRQLELGYGGTVAFNAGVTTVIGFLNARGNPPENFTGRISANLGVAASVDQAAASALSGLAGVVGAIPTPKTAAGAAALAAGAGVLRSAGQAAGAYAGVGYRVEIRFEEGEVKGLYYQGKQIIDIEGFLRRGLGEQEKFQPVQIPDGGIPELANLNYTTQQIAGRSPWDLAATSGGKNNGNASVAVANSWSDAIASFGNRYFGQLSADAKNTVLAGPQSIAQAGDAINAILAVVTPEDFTIIVDQLQNRYDLDFGVPAVKLSNQIRNAGAPTPTDYQFVRNVFQGNYSHSSGSPPSIGGGGHRPF